MIKSFKNIINEDYFSKLANRKDNGGVRKENEITEDFVRSFIISGYECVLKSITIRREQNGQVFVDVDGDFVLARDVEELPFQFGKVTGNFNCYKCTNLKSLKGFPVEIGANLFCESCVSLTSLEGGPQKIGGEFNCTGCYSLKSLNGCPKEVGGDFRARYCGKKFTEEEVKSLCNVKGIIFV